MTYKDILTMDPLKLCGWVQDEFSIDSIKDISSIDDMKKANIINLKLSSYETFFSNLLSFAEVMTRQAKRGGNKAEYEDMVDRKKVIALKHENLKHQRDALSRSVTIYSKMLEEIKYADKY